MKTAVLLANLGTPSSPTTSAIRRFLREFLMDPRVIDLPFLIRSVLVHGFIIPFRTHQATAAYQQIWTPQGSPLLHHSQQLCAQLQQHLGENYHVALGMRYAAPSLSQTLLQFDFSQLEKLIILPLFPQFATATTGSVFYSVFTALNQINTLPRITFINDFYQQPAYIQALAQHWQSSLQTAAVDCVIFSYHGLPKRQIKKMETTPLTCDHHTPCPRINSDNRYCYRAQCYATSRALAHALQLSTTQYRVSFQSRLGRTPWIGPYTDELLKTLYQQGIRHLAIGCPSFITDCLETLEEIDLRARAQWHALGGKSFHYLPCLNATPGWVDGLASMIKKEKDPQ